MCMFIVKLNHVFLLALVEGIVFCAYLDTQSEYYIIRLLYFIHNIIYVPFP
jgi:hypothetical protein